MPHLIRAAAATVLLASAASVSAQTAVIYEEPVTLPLEYTETGIIRAQYIKPGDVSPEDYQRLLAEADKVRGFQQATGSLPVVSAPSTAPADAGATVSAPAPSVTYQTEVGTSRTHTVVKGDTLYNISKRFGVSVEDLQSANTLAGSGIRLGQTLSIPGRTISTRVETQPVRDLSALNTQADLFLASTPEPAARPYAVMPGDTLYGISKRACVGVDALKAANGLADNAISTGQKLALPGGHCLK